ncbi:MAG: alkaline phosphatase family protein [Alphaproteobacteria bacterium]
MLFTRYGWRAMAMAGAMLAAACQTSAPQAAAPAPPPVPHNVVIFVADGLRYGSVNPTDAPALAAVRAEGVDFANSHSIFPTLTTVNASSIATGHYPGDTGNFGNSIYAGDPPLPEAYYNRIAGLEDDTILRGMNARFGGNYIRETSLLSAARAHGYAVAVVGKTGPTGIQNLGSLDDAGAIIIDESTGFKLSPSDAQTVGPPLDPAIAAAMLAANIPAAPPPPRNRPNRAQQDWFTSVATQVLIPQFKAQNKNFVMLFWSPDPDNTQHNQTDSPNALTPGINGPTSHAAVANASGDLQRIRDALAANGLADTTDIIVIADHGFATIARESHTSYSATLHYRDWPQGQLPSGFLAIDIAHALNMPIYQPNGLDVLLNQGLPPRSGHAMIGPAFDQPHVVVAANGGSDLIYLTADDAHALAPRIVQLLTQQDYVGAIFVDDSYGDIPGALPLSAIRLSGGGARTPQPAIVVSFKSFGTGCDNPEMCAAEIADTPLELGQGMHGSLSRAETRNFMAATGPDFKAHFVDSAPISNADIAPTVAHIIGVELPHQGTLRGRVIGEAMQNGSDVNQTPDIRRSTPAANGFVTILNLQRVGDAEYYDAAGAEGRAVGLKTQ